jgi:hypothetical protein
VLEDRASDMSTKHGILYFSIAAWLVRIGVPAPATLIAAWDDA